MPPGDLALAGEHAGDVGLVDAHLFGEFALAAAGAFLHPGEGAGEALARPAQDRCVGGGCGGVGGGDRLGPPAGGKGTVDGEGVVFLTQPVLGTPRDRLEVCERLALGALADDDADRLVHHVPEADETLKEFGVRRAHPVRAEQ
ncbi:hypothetical protein ACFV2N_28460 [Streptomyces sp. NPDC059680]|uniref:hypothetical protein n=1 Tax=Streptomyces sp. NPDC059680 TaxID=3346904 RepID=UPI0036CEB85F